MLLDLFDYQPNDEGGRHSRGGDWFIQPPRTSWGLHLAQCSAHNHTKWCVRMSAQGRVVCICVCCEQSLSALF